MSLNRAQQSAVLKLYAKQLEAGRSHKARTALLTEIYETFNSTIPDWREKLKSILVENEYNVAIMTLDRFIEEEQKRAAVISDEESRPVYSPPTSQEKNTAIKEYQGKLVSYTFFMTCVKRCVSEGIISPEDYSEVEQAIAEHYGFGDDATERIQTPFVQTSVVDGSVPNQNAEYTKQDKEYWENFTAPCKRKVEHETDK